MPRSREALDPSGPGRIDGEMIGFDRDWTPFAPMIAPETVPRGPIPAPKLPVPDRPGEAGPRRAAGWRGGSPRAEVLLAPPERSSSGPADETDPLKRQRIKAAAVALAAMYGLLTFLVFACDNPATFAADGGRCSLLVQLMSLRCLLAAAVAGLLSTGVGLTRGQLRGVERLLFLGLTAALMASQHLVGLDLLGRGPAIGPLQLRLNTVGVIQTLVTMMVYATLIPNPPAVAARMLLAMFAGPVLAVAAIRLHPGMAEVVASFRSNDEEASNVVFLAIGGLVAFYASALLNGLRAELRDARKLGQYRLLEKIGAGGMGEVYRAEHQLLKRPCAIKLIRGEARADPLALARFEREVQSASRLSHPNTIAIYDYGHADDGTFYYAMEYLPGMSLHALVREAGPLPAGRVIHLLRQACASLAEAHAVGLIHRDLKPANLFLAHRGGESDVAKVLDFGLVKLAEAPEAPTLTAELSISGTPSFMAPEQAADPRAVDARADLYALGAVAYFALTGRPPFSGGGAFAIMMAHATERVVPPSSIRPGIPADLEAVVLRALEKKPADRHPDAATMGAALAACEDATAWDARRANRWWRDHLPGRMGATAGA